MIKNDIWIAQMAEQAMISPFQPTLVRRSEGLPVISYGLSSIEDLRNQSSPKKTVPSTLKPTESSKDTIIETLRQRVKKLEVENRELRDQIEVVYGLANLGSVQTESDQQKEIEELTKQNQKLMNLLTQTRMELTTLKEKCVKR